MGNIIEIINALKIKDIVANRSEKSIQINLSCKQYIFIDEEIKIKQYFIDKFKIKKIELIIEYEQCQIDEQIKEDIKNKMIYQIPLLLPFKEQISIKIDGNNGIIEIPNGAQCFIETDETIYNFCNFIKRIDSSILDVKIHFFESEAHNNIVEEIKTNINKKIKEKSIHVKKEKIVNDNSSNKDIKIKREIINIVDINSNYKRVAIKGEILNFEYKSIKNKYEIVNFDITDYTSTIKCKTFLNSKNKKNIKDNVIKGNYVIVEGDYSFDTYEKDNVITIKKIEKTIKDTRIDNLENKRVELHLHTKMSALDGFIEPKKLFSLLHELGHKSVAITDHGVLQAFPEVMKLAKQYDIKAIYGVEGYMIDDGDAYIYNSSDYDINKSYCACYIVNEKADILIWEDEKITDKEIFNIDNFDDILDFIDGRTVVFICDKNNYNLINYLRNNNVEIIRLKKIIEKFFDEKFSKEFLKTHFNMENLYDSATTYKLYEKFKPLLINKGLNCTNKIAINLVNEDEYKSKKKYHIILLAKNQIGLKNLYELISYSHLNFFYKKPIMPRSLIDDKRNGLIIGSACEAGQLYKAVVEKKDIFDINLIASFYDYLEIQPVGNNEYLVREEILKSENDIKEINKKIVEIGDNLNIPVVATCDAHFLNERDSIYRTIIMYGQKYKDAKNQPPLYYRTTEEMFDEFAYFDEETREKIVVENSNKIADMVDNLLPIPEGTFPPKIEGSDEILRTSTINRAKEIYGELLPNIVKERMDRELDSIINNGFSVMYIIAQKLVKKSLNDGYLVGSRGSVGSSFVAFLSGITEVNSLQAHYICPNCKHTEFTVEKNIDCGVDLKDKICSKCGSKYEKTGFDIPFETFLGFYGDKEPDIDLNFSGEYQATAHKFVENLFGEENVFRAGTISTIAPKTAYGFVKNYFEESEENITNAEINRLIKGCNGVKKTTGQHPGGIMVMPKGHSIHEFTPIQKPANLVSSDIITTHFDFHSLHGRLLKLDILGHDDPTMLKMLQNLTGIDPTTINIVDEKIMSLFTSNKELNVLKETTTKLGVLGIPEFGTNFVRGMLSSTKPKTFSELVKISGLSHGTDVWTNNAEDLIKSNIATLNEVICLRDDIMLFLINKGIDEKSAFDIMESVRRGKGITSDEEKLMYAKNISKWYIESCKKIKYMFPKAHAVAYVIMALRVAWFKIYYPLAYYAAYFTIRADEFDCEIMGNGIQIAKNKIRELDNMDKKQNAREKKIRTILESVIEMYARGYEFLPINLYKSHNTDFIIEDNKLRLPFSSVAGLGINAAINIVNERAKGKFISIDELRRRAQLSKPQIEKLSELNGLNSIPKSNQVSFF